MPPDLSSLLCRNPARHRRKAQGQGGILMPVTPVFHAMSAASLAWLQIPVTSPTNALLLQLESSQPFCHLSFNMQKLSLLWRMMKEHPISPDIHELRCLHFELCPAST